MASEDERYGDESPRSALSIAESIKQVVALNARASLDDEKQLLLFMQSWWSKTYNRPLKDPLLLSYTLEELLYEFYDKIEREKAAEENVSKEGDKIEEAKEKEALDWAEEEERKEKEEELRKASAKPTQDPTKDPANVAWMEEQLKKGKEAFGDDFGEDIVEEF